MSASGRGPGMTESPSSGGRLAAIPATTSAPSNLAGGRPFLAPSQPRFDHRTKTEQSLPNLVVPELQRRGRPRTRYAGSTLRDNLLEN